MISCIVKITRNIKAWPQHNNVSGLFSQRFEGLKMNEASTDTSLLSLLYSQTDFMISSADKIYRSRLVLFD